MFSERLVATLRSTTVVIALVALGVVLASTPDPASAATVPKVAVAKASLRHGSGYLRPHPEATEYFDVGFEDESLFNVEFYVEKVLVTLPRPAAVESMASPPTMEISEARRAAISGAG
jgi:hypothetical protein